jgi:hypothetical protein
MLRVDITLALSFAPEARGCPARAGKIRRTPLPRTRMYRGGGSSEPTRTPGAKGYNRGARRAALRCTRESREGPGRAHRKGPAGRKRRRRRAANSWRRSSRSRWAPSPRRAAASRAGRGAQARQHRLGRERGGLEPDEGPPRGRAGLRVGRDQQRAGPRLDVPGRGQRRAGRVPGRVAAQPGGLPRRGRRGRGAPRPVVPGRDQAGHGGAGLHGRQQHRRAQTAPRRGSSSASSRARR